MCLRTQNVTRQTLTKSRRSKESKRNQRERKAERVRIAVAMESVRKSNDDERRMHRATQVQGVGVGGEEGAKGLGRDVDDKKEGEKSEM